MSKSLSSVRAVVGIIRRDDKILIGQRPVDKTYAGYWEFPGGKIELNESSFHALKRELKEELGIEVVKATLWFEHNHTYHDKHVLLEIWLVEDYRGEPTSLENQLLSWATLPEIKKLKVLEGNWPIIEKIAHQNILSPPFNK